MYALGLWGVLWMLFFGCLIHRIVRWIQKKKKARQSIRSEEEGSPSNEMTTLSSSSSLYFIVVQEWGPSQQMDRYLEKHAVPQEFPSTHSIVHLRFPPEDRSVYAYATWGFISHLLQDPLLSNHHFVLLLNLPVSRQEIFRSLFSSSCCLGSGPWEQKTLIEWLRKSTCPVCSAQSKRRS